MVVYLIENQVNGKLYVGKTIKTLKHRWGAHKVDSRRGSANPLHCAMRKYGIDSFTISMITKCSTKEEMDATEKRLIIALSTHTSTGRGYNATWGGDGMESGEKHPLFGVPVPLERRQKMSRAQKGANNASSKAAGPNHWNRGLIRSEETREKIKAKRALQTKTRRGVPVSAETRKHLSEVQKRIMSDPKERKRVSEQTKVGMRRPEVRAKLHGPRKAMLGTGQREMFPW
jgi:group I intron endonuclease